MNFGSFLHSRAKSNHSFSFLVSNERDPKLSIRKGSFILTAFLVPSLFFYSQDFLVVINSALFADSVAEYVFTALGALCHTGESELPGR